MNLDLKATMQEIFGHHTPPNRGGVVRGGDGKLICLACNPLSSVTLRNLVRKPYSSIIEDTRSLFHDSYLHIPQSAEFSSAGESEIQAIRERDPRVQSALKKLSSSDELLAIIDKHLTSTWDVDDDGSLIYPIPVRTPR